MSFDSYMARKAARRDVQREAANYIAKKYAAKGARVEHNDRNLYVYLDAVPNERFKIGPLHIWHELRHDIPATEYSRAHTLWKARKTYSTTKIAALEKK